MSTWDEHKRLADRSTIPDRDGYESAAQYTRERRLRDCTGAYSCKAGEHIHGCHALEPTGAECVKIADKYAASLGLHWPDKPQEGAKP